MNNNIYLIFDFDGTLVDSCQTVISKFNLLSDEFNFRKISKQEVGGLRDLTSRELIKFLEIPIYKIPKVIYHARKLMAQEMHRLSSFKNLPEILTGLYQQKITLGILTSNSSENVLDWLQRNNLHHLFNFIHAESSYFGKKYILKKMIKLYSLDKARTFYIGDETRDIEAAKGCKVCSIAVTWGFNSEKILIAHNPEHIVRNPEELLSLCRSI